MLDLASQPEACLLDETLTLGSRAKTTQPNETLQLPGSKERLSPAERSLFEAAEQDVVALYADHAGGLHRYGKSLTPRTSLVQEAIQEAFLEYFARRLQGKEVPDSRAWLFRAVRDYLQRSREGSEVPAASRLGPDELPDQQQNPESSMHEKEMWARISASLSPREFECLSLRSEGLNYREIAQVMQIRMGTVGVTLARGLRKLHKVL
jgi:RNA polymerase sigma-70 factor (ECF subfamily)